MNVLPYPEVPEPTPTEPVTPVSANGAAIPADSRVNKFRRGFERFRGDSDAYAGAEGQNGESDLELTVLLLREENARLKAERHRPRDVGTMIQHLRRIADEHGEDELSDEVWSLLSECMVIREELDQACIEIKAAMTAVQEHLGRLAMAATALGDTGALPHQAITHERAPHVLELAPDPEQGLGLHSLDQPAIAEQ